MKQTLSFVLMLFFLTNHGLSQQYPDYQMIVPEVVSMNYACNAEFMNTEVYHEQNNSFFKDVVSDSQGNLYFWGVSPYQFSYSDNYTITFGSNSSSPLSFSRMLSSGANISTTNEYKYFIAKYNSIGEPQWVSFMTDPPKKMLLDESENRLYVVYHIVRQIDGISYPTDSIASSECNIIILYDIQTGQVVDYFNRKSVFDFHFIGNKKIVPIYISGEGFFLGFYENNQIVKKQSFWVNQGMPKLHYNPHQNAFWYMQGNNYYRLLLHPTEDSLIEENISRPLYYENVPPYGTLSSIKKFHFLPGGYYLGELYNTSNIETTPILVKVDSLGNLVWRIAFKPGIPPCSSCSWDDLYEYAIDHEGNVWTDIRRVYYDSYLEFTPSGQSYFVNEKNLELADALWKIDGNTGTLLQAYHKGWGCYTGDGGKVIHVTSQNKLIVTMHNRGIVYVPNENGIFQPYYENCTGLQQSSPFMWVNYDLSNIHVTSVDNFLYADNKNKFTLYPNPSTGKFILKTEQGGVFELMDISGKVFKIFQLQNSIEQIQANLPGGLYFIREKESGTTLKLIIE